MRITNKILDFKIAHTNEITSAIFDSKAINNRIFNGYNHLQIDGETIFAGTNKECAEFLDGLRNFAYRNEKRG